MDNNINNQNPSSPQNIAPEDKFKDNSKDGSKDNSEDSSKNTQGIRVAKVIAQSGYCSRRVAESLIAEGRVQVNGKTIDHPAVFITDHSIKIDGKLISSKQPPRVFLFYKPVGFICSSDDPQGRKTIFDLLPKNLPRLISVGRLDFNTEGLLVLTTNGAIARYMELPKNQWVRKYRARVFGKLNHERLQALIKGITIEGIRYSSIKVEIDQEKESNSWLTISINEGKNREIRKIMEHLGLQVNRLIRVSFGPFLLGDMKIGDIHEVNKKILKNSVPLDLL
jgi:23S rRNA pseudouridine2605 synthase